MIAFRAEEGGDDAVGEGEVGGVEFFEGEGVERGGGMCFGELSHPPRHTFSHIPSLPHVD